MARRRVLAARLALIVLLSAAPASAQTAGTLTGAISGTVTDSTGGVLSNVTVTVSSDALMTPRVAVTGQHGDYRVTAIPAGTYVVVVRRTGFRSVTVPGVLVGTGGSATVNAVLGIDTIAETTDVTAQSRVVDRHSTGVTTHLAAAQLAHVPNSRTVFAILSFTPAIQVSRFEVGGASGDAAAQYAAYGTFGWNWPTVEGISISGMFPLGFTLDFGALDDVTVYTAAHSAEWQAPGVHMRMVSKSGGDTYRGSLYADYEHRSWQAFNIDQDQIDRNAPGGVIPAREANRLWSYYDASTDIGGFIRRNRLWWYASTRHQNIAIRQVNFPIKPLPTQLNNLSGKVNARLSGNHSLVAYGQAGRNHRPHRLDPFGAGGLTAASALNQSETDTVEQIAWGWVWKGEWTAVFGDRLFVESRAGQFGADRPERPYSDAPRYEDPMTSKVSGGNRDWQETLRRDHVTASATWFVDRWLGSHKIKAGTEIVQLISTEAWKRSYPGDVLHVLNQGAPSLVYLFQTPSESRAGLFLPSFYLTDAWRPAERLTLEAGFRFDRFRLFLPAQAHPAGRFNQTPQTFPAVNNLIDWNSVVPRLSAILDLGGDGRTLAKVVYGHYSFGANPDLAANASPNSRVWWRLYPWADDNRNGVWDEGEEVETQLKGSRGGVELEKIDPRLELPLMREAGAWLEREMPARIRVKTGFVWRGLHGSFMRQNIENPAAEFTEPVVLADDGPDGQPGTSDDGPAIHAYQVGSGFLPIPQTFEVRNVPGADARYVTWDFTADRQSSGRWSFAAGASVTWFADQAAGYLGQPVRQNTYPLNPNDLINTGEDGRHEFTTWTFKLYGTYRAPWGLRATPYLRHQSGQPFGRTIRATLNYGEGRVPILVEPVGTRRTDNVTLLDVRLEKSSRASGRRITGFLDVFNLFNANPEQNVSFATATFLRPLNIVSPRIARIGVRIDW